MLDWQMSEAGQIFAPAKSAFMPSMAISRRRQAYTDVFMASCQASYRTLHGETVLNFLTLVSQYNLSRILCHA
ncbi:hypothetical protein EQU24_01440 [Methylotuvimicrobium buryatense]|uniref:Uncharacterized protein n=1 Tax=Methylotuvimicrobium buryatense TaxID=95641 RepID=A0A4P9ULP3_METBY|nr:hypothetical protein EQU24_01440 [Methylotuvimicrobium buryatense]